MDFLVSRPVVLAEARAKSEALTLEQINKAITWLRPEETKHRIFQRAVSTGHPAS